MHQRNNKMPFQKMINAFIELVGSGQNSAWNIPDKEIVDVVKSTNWKSDDVNLHLRKQVCNIQLVQSS